MKLLFAVDRNFAIGFQGDMLFHIPEDLRRFRRLTSDNIVVMGRKTLESLPGGRPLPNRTNIVLTRNPDYVRDDLHVVHDIAQLDKLLHALTAAEKRTVFLIGGGDLVRQLIDRCDEASITMLDRSSENADTHITNLDEAPEWQLVSESAPFPFEDTTFTYREYRRCANTNESSILC